MSLLRFLGLGDAARGQENEPASLALIEAQIEDLPPEQARLVAAFSYLLARIAGADLRTEDSERAAMTARLASFAEIDTRLASLLSQTAIQAEKTYSAADDHLVARTFREISTEQERIKLVRCLYAVAAADETISTREDNEIFDVAEAIGVRRLDVVAVRTEFKEFLGTLKALPTEG